MSFYLCGEVVDFYVLPPTTPSFHTVHLVHADPIHSIPSSVVSRIEVFKGDGRPHRFVALSNLPLPILATLGAFMFVLRR